MFENYNDLLTVAEVCSALRIGRNSAYAIIASGELKSIRIGKSIKIPKKYLIDFVMNSDSDNLQ